MSQDFASSRQGAGASPLVGWLAGLDSQVARARTAADAGRPAPRSATPAPELTRLMQFRSLMQTEGEVVQLPRMRFDRRYAFDRLARAHACNNDPLRRLALELFQTYQRREEQRAAVVHAQAPVLAATD